MCQNEILDPFKNAKPRVLTDLKTPFTKSLGKSCLATGAIDSRLTRRLWGKDVCVE